MFLSGHAHCGFPEIAYGRFADQLISRGYKVGRIEQTETVEMADDRRRSEGVRGKTDKCVKR